MICTDTKECLEETKRVLKAGGVAVFPTDTVYGVGAYLDMKDAVERIYIIKKRSRSKPLAVLVRDKKMAYKLGEFNSIAKRLADKFWPGPLTIIVPTKGGKIGLRVPNHWFARELAERPLAASSANLSGEKPPKKFEDALTLEGADIYVDGGELPGVASTVFDSTTLKIIRRGAVTDSKIMGVINE